MAHAPSVSAQVKRGWVLYDFANSAYHLMIPTVLVPLYFREYLGRGLESPDLIWSLLISIPVVIAGLVAPFVGAGTDLGGRRFGALAVLTILSAITIASLAILPQGSWFWGAALFSVSYFCFILALALYDAFLPLIAGKSERSRLSGLGWGVGYLGGIIAVALAFPFLKDAELPTGATGFQISVGLTAVLFLSFALVSLYLMRTLRGREVGEVVGVVRPATAWLRIRQTLRNWKDNREFFKTMLSFYFANDGLATLVYFTSIYAAVTLGFSSQQVLVLFLIVQLIGIPATIVAGYAAQKFSKKSVILITLAIWVILIVGFAVASGIAAFYILALGTGLVIGSTPAIYRSLLADYVKPEKAAESFGYNAFATRTSAIMGPILFGIISTVVSQRVAMLSLLAFFVLAGVVLLRVREEKNHA